MTKITTFRDLNVYQKLKSLHLEVHAESLKFPKFEMYELGSQVRRSSNAAPAILAEGWGSRHTNIYLEAINRSLGEVRETQHHLDIAASKHYLTPKRFQELDTAYNHCGGMLERLYQSLNQWRGSRRSDSELRETPPPYGIPTQSPDVEWDHIVALTEQILSTPDIPQPPTDNP
ncbi:MAG: four helix bundle protein [Verrucomicrobiae bacterium]|nr:four helix bundle protein [Verrucomicrobiae bacterium]